MFALFNKTENFNAPEILDNIQKEVYEVLKPHGFKKHGRTFHRFVSGDISQVIVFHLGQAYRDETHLLTVHLGIRVPECVNRSFTPEEKKKKYYYDYECNIRSQLGEIENKNPSCYNLKKAYKPIVKDILRQINDIVLPVFYNLDSRNAILNNRRKYPEFDILNRKLILREEAMIYGYLGDITKAHQVFNEDFKRLKSYIEISDAGIGIKKAWVENQFELANKLNIAIIPENIEWIQAFLKL